MRERPILFSGAMVRAILSGEKTQTRRLVKWRSCRADMQDGNVLLPMQDGSFWPAYRIDGDERFIDCPHGGRGDRLWVRESWCSWETRCDHDHAGPCAEHCHQVYVAYGATPRVGYRPRPDRASIRHLDDSTPLEADRHLVGPWKPSIHMPRWASRITLEITGVRVERLQDISEEDARAEGIQQKMLCELWLCIPKGDGGAYEVLIEPDAEERAELEHVKHRPAKPMYSARDEFRFLWDSINAKRASWESNPWVWVVEFRRLP